MKTKYTLFRRGGMFYVQDSATGKQTSLRTKDETEAKSLLNARNEAQRQPVLNLHLARAYLAADFGGLVLCAKKEERRQWQQWAADCNRTDDLVIVDSTGTFRFNFLEWEARRPDAS